VIAGPPPGGLVAREERMLSERLLDETVLLDPASGRYVRLNASATLLWEALAQPATLTALAQRLAAHYALDPDRAHADAARFVASLAERGVVRVSASTDAE
jgi:PqqD family protein of HPr-rel-A system